MESDLLVWWVNDTEQYVQLQQFGNTYIHKILIILFSHMDNTS